MPFTCLQGNAEIFCVSGKAEWFTYEIMYVFLAEEICIKVSQFHDETFS